MVYHKRLRACIKLMFATKFGFSSAVVVEGIRGTGISTPGDLIKETNPLITTYTCLCVCVCVSVCFSV